MIMSTWVKALYERLGGELPTDYCCIDLETSGFSRKDDLILEMGHCLVYDSKIETRYNIALNWVDYDDVPNAWLESRLSRLKKVMTEEGKSWHIDMDYLSKGMDPVKALKFYHEYITTLIENETFLVLHNGFTFDEPFMQASFADFLGEKDFSLGNDHVMDTSALVKASQLTEEAGIAPQSNENTRQYFQRIHGRRRKGVYSNLKFCVERFRLKEKYDLDTALLHSAGYDAYVCHLLVEEIREWLKPKLPPVPKVLQKQQVRRAIPKRVKPVTAAGTKNKVKRHKRGRA